MKRIITLLLVLCTLVMISACGETDEQKAKRLHEETQRATEAYEKSLDNYNNLLDDLEDYQKSQDYLDSFK